LFHFPNKARSKSDETRELCNNRPILWYTETSPCTAPQVTDLDAERSQGIVKGILVPKLALC